MKKKNTQFINYNQYKIDGNNPMAIVPIQPTSAYIAPNYSFLAFRTQ